VPRGGGFVLSAPPPSPSPRHARAGRPRRHRPDRMSRAARRESSRWGYAPVRGGEDAGAANSKHGRCVMATLVAIAYPDQGTAEEARGVVQGLEADLVIQADQVAAISRDLDGKYHVTTTHGGASAGAGAWWGGFWGML